jgi:multiple antibiotic resistance protein
MPMVAGPGAIVTVIVNTHQHRGIESNLEMSAVCVVMAVLIGACFLAAGHIARVLGGHGMDILTKFMGLVLLSIAIGMLASGIKGLLPGLAG